MKKIDINLYPSTIKGDKRISQLMSNYFPFALLAFCGIIIINIILFIFTGLSSISYTRVEKKWQKVSGPAQELVFLKKEVKFLKEKQRNYNELLSLHVDVSHICGDIYTALPKSIWLEEIKFREGSLKITGYAVRWKEDPAISIDKFVKSLKREKYVSSLFDTIGSRGTRKAEFRGREVEKFEVICKSSK